MNERNFNNFLDPIAQIWGSQRLTLEATPATKKLIKSMVKLRDKITESPATGVLKERKSPGKKII